MDQVRRKTNATSAYQRHLTGKGVTVAFLDTGISMHPDLQGRILAFRDFQNGKKYPYDDSGHAAGADSFPEASMPEWHREPGL